MYLLYNKMIGQCNVKKQNTKNTRFVSNCGRKDNDRAVSDKIYSMTMNGGIEYVEEFTRFS